jgi:dTDP-4-dehydrorhamnose 3,5-epimerase
LIFVETPLPGAFLIHPELLQDERGFFTRVWCQREFAEHALISTPVQCSLSFNLRKGTLRGMHFQEAPFEEAKLVRCSQGALYDVIVDLRPESPAFKQHFGTQLTAENRHALYVPKGFAHGFLTLEDNTEVFYQISQFYSPEHSRGFRWNDPALNISWPAEVRVISERDRGYPNCDL